MGIYSTAIREFIEANLPERVIEDTAEERDRVRMRTYLLGKLSDTEGLRSEAADLNSSLEFIGDLLALTDCWQRASCHFAGSTALQLRLAVAQIKKRPRHGGDSGIARLAEALINVLLDNNVALAQWVHFYEKAALLKKQAKLVVSSKSGGLKKRIAKAKEKHPDLPDVVRRYWVELGRGFHSEGEARSREHREYLNSHPTAFSKACSVYLMLLDREKSFHANYARQEEAMHQCVAGHRIASHELKKCHEKYRRGESRRMALQANVVQVRAELNEAQVRAERLREKLSEYAERKRRCRLLYKHYEKELDGWREGVSLHRQGSRAEYSELVKKKNESKQELLRLERLLEQDGAHYHAIIEEHAELEGGLSELGAQLARVESFVSSCRQRFIICDKRLLEAERRVSRAQSALTAACDDWAKADHQLSEFLKKEPELDFARRYWELMECNCAAVLVIEFELLDSLVSGDDDLLFNGFYFEREAKSVVSTTVASLFVEPVGGGAPSSRAGAKPAAAAVEASWHPGAGEPRPPGG